MEQLFQWISNTPIAGIVLLSLLAIFMLAVIVTYLVAFYQGREISLWPPKLGARPFSQDNGRKGIPIADVSETEINQVGAGHVSKYGAAKPTENFECVDREQLWNQTSLPSLRLSSKPIAVIEGVDGPVNGSIYIVVTGHRDITVGSGSACDLPISSPLLSRHHFRLRVSLTERTEKAGRGFIFELIDSGSTNGTFLNGRRVGNPSVVESGDLIEAGDCGFRFFVLAATQYKA